MAPIASVIGAITHLCLASNKRDTGKHRRPRSNTAERGVWSGSTLFAWIHKFITKTRAFKYIENFTTKNWKFSDKNSDIFHISAQNIDCWYSLEQPWPQSMFLSRNKKTGLYCQTNKR